MTRDDPGLAAGTKRRHVTLITGHSGSQAIKVAREICAVANACLVDATCVPAEGIASVVSARSSGAGAPVPAGQQHTFVALAADVDVAWAAERLLGDARTSAGWVLDGVVMVVDARTAAARMACGAGVVDSGPELLATVMADAIVIRHLAHLTDRASDLVAWTLWGLNPSARFSIDLEPREEGRVLTELAGFDLDALEGWLQRRNPQSSWTSTHEQEDASACSIRVRFDGCIDPAGFHCWLEERRHSGCTDVHRWHAVAGIAGEQCRWLAQGVRSFVEARPGPRWDRVGPHCDLYMIGNLQALRRVGSAFAGLAVG